VQRGAPVHGMPIRVHLYLTRFPPLVRDRSVCTHEVDGRLLEGFPFIRTRVSVCELTTTGEGGPPQRSEVVLRDSRAYTERRISYQLRELLITTLRIVADRDVTRDCGAARRRAS